ncbi:MAG: glycosyltransferase family 4 protein [Anaerolineae bacterium]|nr:glycosyltransferase family 4 protein [Anaerolineae bacterium]
MTVWHLDPAAFTLAYERRLVQALRTCGVDACLLTSQSVYDTSPLQPFEKHVYFRLLQRFPILNKYPLVRRVSRGLHLFYDQQQLFRHGQPDILHLHWLMNSIKNRKNLKMVLTVHDLVPNHLPEKAAHRYFRQYQQIDYLIVHSEKNAEDLRVWGKKLGYTFKIRVIPHGTLYEQPAPDLKIRQRLHIPPDAPLLLFFGVLQKYKGLPVLLEAFEQVRAEMPETRLLVAGYVSRTVPEGILPRLQNHPFIHTDLRFIPDAEVPAYFAAADITVLPYMYVTQSGVALAALTQGCPMVASDVGGLSDVVIPEETGLLVPPNDAPALAQTLLTLLKNPDLRQKMSQQGRLLAHQKFNWSWIADQTRALYEELLA